MKYSVPIFVLKRRAKSLARDAAIPLHQALDKVAATEGFASWSHLASSSAKQAPANKILFQLNPGDLWLIGARPGQGKTRLGLELAAGAIRIGRKGYFFTLDYNTREVAEQFASMGFDPHKSGVVVDTSDEISAEYIIGRLSAANSALVVVDYLQILDQKRTNPSLDCQMSTLRKYLNDTGAIAVVISQIDRRFDLDGKIVPDISDIRQPNPLDLTVFSTCVFLHSGKIQIDQVA